MALREISTNLYIQTGNENQGTYDIGLSVGISAACTAPKLEPEPAKKSKAKKSEPQYTKAQFDEALAKVSKRMGDRAQKAKRGGFIGPDASKKLLDKMRNATNA